MLTAKCSPAEQIFEEYGSPALDDRSLIFGHAMGARHEKKRTWRPIFDEHNQTIAFTEQHDDGLHVFVGSREVGIVGDLEAQAELFEEKEATAAPAQLEAFDADGQISADLIRYEAVADRALVLDKAERALEAATSVEQVKQIHDLAIGMAAYAKTANNRDLEADAHEIRMRATRRLGEMMRSQRDTVGLNSGAKGVGTSVRVDDKPTLASQGIDKNLAHAARTAAAMTGPEFEASVESARGHAKTRRATLKRSKRSGTPQDKFGRYVDHFSEIIPLAMESLEPRQAKQLIGTVRRLLAEAERELKRKAKPAKPKRKKSKPRPRPAPVASAEPLH